jgi:beta-lactamase regulating signal transducer with metallopeptidase domain
MIAAWMLRAVAASALIALAALLAAEAARLAGRPRRWAWAAGLVLAVAVPVAGWWFPGALSLAGGADGAGGTMDWLLARAGTGAALPTKTESWSMLSLLDGLDGPLAWLWAAATAATTAVFAATQWRLRRARRRWTPAEVAGTPVLVAEAVGPAVVGVVSPRVVLPRWALEAPAEERALMVRHERAHLEAGDSRLLAATAAAVALMPWNPALWWMHRRLRDAMETDCDARVLARGADPWTYGQTLLRIAARPSARRLLLSPALGRPTLLERRIVAMTSTLPKNRTPRALALAVIAAAAVVAACEAAATEPVSAPRRAGTAEFIATVAEDGQSKVTVREMEDADELVPSTAGEGPAKVTVEGGEGGTFTFRRTTSGTESSGGTITVRRAGNAQMGPDPMFYVDGQLTTAAAIRAIDPSSIEKVEILKGESAVAVNPQAVHGIVKITLRKN